MSAATHTEHIYARNPPPRSSLKPQAPSLFNWGRFFVGQLLAEAAVRPATIAAYRADLDDFLRWCQEARITSGGQLSQTVIDMHLAALAARGLCNCSLARHLASLKRFLRLLFAERAMAADLAELLGVPKGERKLPRVLNRSSAERLLAGPQASKLQPLTRHRCQQGLKPQALRDRAILELLYATGCRVGELVSLRLCDVDVDGRIARVFGKGGKERLVPFGRSAAAALSVYLAELRPLHAKRCLGCQAFFVTRTGQPMDRFGVWRMVRDRARELGLSASPHTLRHSCATHLLEGGANLRVVQEILGHADVSTTERYTHVSVEHLKRVHRRCHPRP